MALTKISTGGVKDDAASQAKIADEAVDEARLQISNAGTNGQFLSKQSGNTGGLTWSDVPAQYTHPNHSGEVTSTGDGATVIASNIVDEDNLKVSNTPTNGQFLSAQSGNTGGLTWSDVTIPPSGNTVDLVADGAIAAGKPVIITTAGKAKQVTAVYTPKTAFMSNTTVQQANGDANGVHMKHHSTVWDDTNDRFYTLQHKNSGGFAWLHTWTVNSSSGAVTYGGNLSLANHEESSDCPKTDIAWSTTDEMLLEVYKTNSGNYINYRVFDPGSYSGSTLQWSHGSELEVHSGDADSVRLAYDSTRNKFVCSFRDKGDSNKMAIYVGTLNTSAKTVTWGSKQTVDSRTSCGFRHGICSMGSGNFCVAYSSGSEVYAKIGEISSSANSATFGSEAEITNTSLQGEYPEVEYEFAQSKLVFVYRDPNNGYIKAQSATHNGTAFQYISLSPAAVDSNNVHHIYRPVYNSLAGRIYVITVREENGGTPRVNHIDVSGTHASAGSNTAFGAGSVELIHDIAYNNNNGELFYVGGHTVSNDMLAVRVPIAEQTTNITLNNFLGFAPSAINDTATGTINLPGNTVDNQSGLSPGTRYFIADDGTFQTNGSSSVNKSHGGLVAVSATKGVIVGQGAFT